ncbi:hypothetical protein OSTOST_02642 [Ostertagia ostertagi]
MAIPAHHFALVPFNGQAIFSYLDPATLVVSQNASPADCSAVRYFYLSHNSSYHKFDSLTGETQVVPFSSIRNVRVASEHAPSGLVGPSPFSLWTLLFGPWSFSIFGSPFAALLYPSAAITLYCNLFYPGWLPRLQEHIFEPSALSWRTIARPTLRPSLTSPYRTSANSS